MLAQGNVNQSDKSANGTILGITAFIAEFPLTSSPSGRADEAVDGFGANGLGSDGHVSYARNGLRT
jgi:hypothetical protein